MAWWRATDGGGDVRGAKQSFVDGLNYIADGVSQRLTPDGRRSRASIHAPGR